jgi:hypothetical protein
MGTHGADGKIVMQDSMLHPEIRKGKTTRLGRFSIPLAGLPVPAKYRITLSVAGSSWKNQWDLWVYSTDIQESGSGIVETSSFSEAVAALQKGEKVLLNPEFTDISGITGKFVPVFWSPVHFPDQPGTMGLLMDPEHAALEHFPTDFHSNWQWWDLCKNSKTIVTDSLSIDPIVTVIDNFFKNRNLCMVFEAKVGTGKLIFCSADVHSRLAERPVARQLRFSLLSYMNGNGFDPKKSLPAEKLLSLNAVADR